MPLLLLQVAERTMWYTQNIRKLTASYQGQDTHSGSITRLITQHLIYMYIYIYIYPAKPYRYLATQSLSITTPHPFCLLSITVSKNQCFPKGQWDRIHTTITNRDDHHTLKQSHPESHSPYNLAGYCYL